MPGPVSDSSKGPSDTAPGTGENVPMGMPKNVEKVVAPVVRAALGKKAEPIK